VVFFSAKPKQPAESKQGLSKGSHALALANASVVVNKRVCVDEAHIESAKETPSANQEKLSPLPLGCKLQIQENLNRLDTRLCFALAREDLSLKVWLLKQRQGIETRCGDMNSELPDKLLPTPVLQSKKHAVELEISKAQLQLRAKPTDMQVELQAALERELSRRIPGRCAEQSTEKDCLRGLSHSEFLMAYSVCAQRLYMQASTPDTSYENLVSFWGKWQTHAKEAENRFGEAWLWQYV
jgi:hypothetical protein